MHPVDLVLLIPKKLYDWANRPFDREYHQLVRDVQAKMPAIDAGRTWLEQANRLMPDDQRFLDVYERELRSLAPVLRPGVTNIWIDVLEDGSVGERLSSEAIMKLLAAITVWQVAAAERALRRQQVTVTELDTLLQPALVRELKLYLEEQGLAEAAPWYEQASQHTGELYTAVVKAPEVDDGGDDGDLINATCTFCGIDNSDTLNTALSRGWRMIDMIALPLIHRGFGEMLKDRSTKVQTSPTVPRDPFTHAGQR